jgi:leucyl aminopeptidase
MQSQYVLNAVNPNGLVIMAALTVACVIALGARAPPLPEYVPMSTLALSAVVAFGAFSAQVGALVVPLPIST